MQLVSDPDFFFEFVFALPISKTFNPYVSAWFTKFKTQGKVVSAIQQNVIKPTPDVCTVVAGEFDAIKLKDMIGVNLIGVGIMLIGAALALVHFIMAFLASRKGATADDEALVCIPEEGADKVVDMTTMTTEEAIAHTKGLANQLKKMVDALPSAVGGAGGGGGGGGDDAKANGNGAHENGGNDSSRPKGEPAEGGGEGGGADGNGLFGWDTGLGFKL